MNFIYQPTRYFFANNPFLKPEPLFLKIGFIILAIWIIRELKKNNLMLKPKDMFWFLFAVIFGSLAGARLWYYLSSWQGPQTLIHLFDPTKPALTSYGTLLWGMLGIMIFTYKYNKKSEK